MAGLGGRMDDQVGLEFFQGGQNFLAVANVDVTMAERGVGGS